MFEGRPNVFADAAGVVRNGNTVVMRIGSDALGTAEAIVEHALAPALAQAGLPSGTVSLVAFAFTCRRLGAVLRRPARPRRRPRLWAMPSGNSAPSLVTPVPR